MILKGTTWVSSDKKLTDPETEKLAFQSVLTKYMKELMKLKGQDPTDLLTSTSKLRKAERDLQLHLKELDAKVLDHEEVLKAMKKGLEG